MLISQVVSSGISLGWGHPSACRFACLAWDPLPFQRLRGALSQDTWVSHCHHFGGDPGHITSSFWAWCPYLFGEDLNSVSTKAYQQHGICLPLPSSTYWGFIMCAGAQLAWGIKDSGRPGSKTLALKHCHYMHLVMELRRPALEGLVRLNMFICAKHLG